MYIAIYLFNESESLSKLLSQLIGVLGLGVIIGNNKTVDHQRRMFYQGRRPEAGDGRYA